MSSDHVSADRVSRIVREWSVRLLMLFWPLMLIGIGMAALSLLLRWLHVSATVAAVVGLAGFLVVSVAVASQSVTVRERQWVLISAALISVTGIMFALQVSRPVPNAVFVLVAVSAVVSYVVAVVRRDVR